MPHPESRTTTATAGAPSANRDGAASRAEVPTVGHGVAGIDGQLLERGLQRTRVGAAGRTTLANVDGDIDPVAQRAAQQMREGTQQGEDFHVAGSHACIPAHATRSSASLSPRWMSAHNAAFERPPSQALGPWRGSTP